MNEFKSDNNKCPTTTLTKRVEASFIVKLTVAKSQFFKSKPRQLIPILKSSSNLKPIYVPPYAIRKLKLIAD